MTPALPAWLLHFSSLFCFSENGIERRLWFIVGIEQQRAALCAPGNSIIHSPESNDLYGVVVFQECAEQVRVLVSEPAIGIVDQAALGGGGIIGDIRPGIALAAFGAIHVELRDVDWQPELFQVS
jgi:hypothetical protein